MRNTKKLTALLLAAIMVLSLCACGEINVSTTLNDDGTGTYEQSVIFTLPIDEVDPTTVEYTKEENLASAEAIAQLKAQGINYTPIDETTDTEVKMGYVASFSFSDLNDGYNKLNILTTIDTDGVVAEFNGVSSDGATNLFNFIYINDQNQLIVVDTETANQISKSHINTGTQGHEYKSSETANSMATGYYTFTLPGEVIESTANKIEPVAGYVTEHNGEAAYTYTWYIDGEYPYVRAQLTESQANKLKGKLISTGNINDVVIGNNFTDIEGHWAREALFAMNRMGVMAGTSDTTMSPDGLLTRAQASAMIYRAFKDNSNMVKVGTPKVFNDVTAGSWYKEAVDWVSTVGFMNGTSATTFSPDGKLTHEQLAMVLSNIGNGKEAPEPILTLVNDLDNCGDWSRQAVDYCNRNGVFVDILDENFNFNPQQQTTRAEFASMLYEFMQNVAI